MYLTVIIKTIFLYFFIILAYRVMGKKEVGKLSIIDLIVSILIAELVAVAIENEDKSIWYSIIPIITLVVIQVSLSFVSIKSRRFRNIVDGRPIVIIKDGKIVFSQMRKLRYSLEDLIAQLREQSIRSLEEVDYAILENNGKLSVFKKCDSYPMPLIIDGVLDRVVLYNIKKDEKWVKDLLKRQNLKIEDVFYAIYTKNKTYIIKKDEML